MQEHREQLLSALGDRLTVNRDSIKDKWTEPANRVQIERETRWIEDFLTANGLQAGDA